MKFAHTVAVPSGASQANQGQVMVGNIPGVANLAGGGAGTSVVTAVAVQGLPASYSVLVNPGQDATWFVTGKTATGFNVTMLPRLAANTLAAGAFDVVILA